jgi:palmitoyl-protein thioesterase
LICLVALARKTNLKKANLFAEERTMPWHWQSSVSVDGPRWMDIIEAKIMNLTIVNMTETLEYTADNFGPKALKERGGLFLLETASTFAVAGATTTAVIWPPLHSYHFDPVLH